MYGTWQYVTMSAHMKKILHYALLAAILLGTPLVCCLIGGYEQKAQLSSEEDEDCTDYDRVADAQRQTDGETFMCTTSFIGAVIL